MVELMVAITLGLILTGAALSVFIGSRGAYQSTAGVGALADGGRFALDTIQESARGAGFMAWMSIWCPRRRAAAANCSTCRKALSAPKR